MFKLGKFVSDLFATGAPAETPKISGSQGASEDAAAAAPTMQSGPAAAADSSDRASDKGIATRDEVFSGIRELVTPDALEALGASVSNEWNAFLGGEINRIKSALRDSASLGSELPVSLNRLTAWVLENGRSPSMQASLARASNWGFLSESHAIGVMGSLDAEAQVIYLLASAGSRGFDEDCGRALYDYSNRNQTRLNVAQMIGIAKTLDSSGPQEALQRAVDTQSESVKDLIAILRANPKAGLTMLSKAQRMPKWVGKSSGGKPYTPKQADDLTALEKNRASVVVRGTGRFEAVAAGQAVRTQIDAPMLDKETIAALQKRPDPTVAYTYFNSKMGSGVGVITVLPAGFDVKRDPPYPLVVLEASGAEAGGAVASAIANKLDAAKTDSVVLIPFGPKGSAWRDTFEGEILQPAYESLNIDAGQISMGKLDVRSDWSLAAVSASAEKVQPRFVTTYADGGWLDLLPTRNSEVTLPAAKADATTPIPKELARTTAAQGRFLSPVLLSEALGKPIRVGVYVPPGYDPDNAEPLPLLVLLPGRGNPLTHYTTAGQIIPKLDHMMSGEAQKAIVIIPDNTDSFYLNETAPGQLGTGVISKMSSVSSWRIFGGGGSDEKPALYEDFIMKDVIGYAKSQFAIDDTRIGISGISRGAFGAMSLAMRHPRVFSAVSAQAPVFPKGQMDLGGVLLNIDSTTREQVNPYDLAFKIPDADLPKHVCIESGDSDHGRKEEGLALAYVLEKRGVKPEVRVYTHPEKRLGHNWEAWEPMFEPLVAFHQRAFGGQPGEARAAGLVNIGGKLMEQTRSDHASKEEREKKARAALSEQIPALKELLAALSTTDARGLDISTRDAEQALAQASRTMNEEPSLFDRLQRMTDSSPTSQADRMKSLIERAEIDLAAARVWPSLPKNVRSVLNRVSSRTSRAELEVRKLIMTRGSLLQPGAEGHQKVMDALQALVKFDDSDDVAMYVSKIVSGGAESAVTDPKPRYRPSSYLSGGGGYGGGGGYRSGGYFSDSRDDNRYGGRSEQPKGPVISSKSWTG